MGSVELVGVVDVKYRHLLSSSCYVGRVGENADLRLLDNYIVTFVDSVSAYPYRVIVMKYLVTRLNPNDHDTSHTLVIRRIKPSSASDIWRHKQGTLKRYGLPNGREHTAECTCSKERYKRMPKVANIKVGTRNRAKSASRVEFLFDWAELFDTNGDYYSPMVSKGIVLTEGEDYRITDASGTPISLKSAPEKVRREIIRHVVDNLNCPVSVKVPDTGQNVSTADRGWVMFRPRMDVPFTSENARAEYLDKNGITTSVVASSETTDEEE